LAQLEANNRILVGYDVGKKIHDNRSVKSEFNELTSNKSWRYAKVVFLYLAMYFEFAAFEITAD